ncbi:KamA family radical SAM protein [Williamwhitmania taraxaci]|uniref:Lysine 2,3-aminomutase n=1 Tax=Williamwhitmania taraxaci TaxID=1640674 RepID=A0A1G6I1A5_9BACT|nr:KamA family radical SAM protein [Williamwhitmania taraxaci]SDC00339.1 lysine 2,3-aminomutase [Williamwhitmania taraxaci]
METDNQIFHEPRAYDSIDLWKDVTPEQWNDAAWQMKHSIRSVEQLKKVIKLSAFQASEIERTLAALRSQGKEPLRITPYYATLMDSDPFHPIMPMGEKPKKRLDPIFWQSVPTPANLLFPDTGVEGAMAEGSRSYGAAYQRYPNRLALFVAENTSCASYCVHCQRAKSLDGSVDVSRTEVDKGLFYIGSNRNINEVLVTGGDALMISRSRLQYILEELSRIPHLRAIRIATRVPVVLPMAITDELLDLIEISANRYNNGAEKYVYFMTHINHYHEITKDLAVAVKKIRKHGFTIRNQTVLLNHVNDYYKTLAETFRRMFWIGIHPYYLLQCHKERGIVHFITPVQVGKIYMKHLQGWISGVTMPRYAANVEGGGGKVLLMPSGHDTFNVGSNNEDQISESYATVTTWDGKELFNYEALGRATREEFEAAVKVMDEFIGRKGVFLPKVILVDQDGKHIETTNRLKLPIIEKLKKSALLGYDLFDNEMPITNPAEITNRLDEQFRNSKYSKQQ